MGLFRKKGEQAAIAQTVRESASPFGNLGGNVLLHTQENALYDAIREAVPIVDAAIAKIVRLTGSFVPDCGNARADKALAELFETVAVAGGGAGIDAFVWQHLDSLLCYGNAVGEMVLDHEKKRIALLYNAPLQNLEIRQSHQTLNSEICVTRGTQSTPVPRPELVLHTALNPRCGEVKGVSLLRGLPFVCSVLLKIYQSIGQNFERMGNLRFAVTYRPGEGTPDKAYAKERAMQIAREWSASMNGDSGKVRDFIAVGDVDIKVIGADNQVLDSQVPVRQMLEQIVAKTGLPPFLLGLSWSTTERMSAQQADLLTSELEYYRRLVTPAILRIAGLHLRLCGIYCAPRILWKDINLQDAVELARARLYNAQANRLQKEDETI